MSSVNGEHRSESPTQKDPAKRGPLLDSFRAFWIGDLLEEIKLQQETGALLRDQWEQEVSLYEAAFEHPVAGAGGPTVALPQRNYPNDQGEVQDPRLFPYHTSCYWLIDAYNSLYDEEDQSSEATIGKLRYTAPDDVDITAFDRGTDVGRGALPDNVLLSSGASLYLTFLEPEWMFASDQDDVLFARKLRDGASERIRATGGSDGEYAWLECAEASGRNRWEIIVAPPHFRYGKHYFPTCNDEKADLLLKLLRHSMSEIQRDHRLATAVLDLISRWKLCDRPLFLRQLWYILATERVACDGYCERRFTIRQSVQDEDQQLDHSCDAWNDIFLPSLAGLFWRGMTYFSSEHSKIVGAFLQAQFDEAFRAAAKVEESIFKERLGVRDQRSITSKQKALLKRNLVYQMNNDEDEEDTLYGIPPNFEKRFPYLFTTRVVAGLGHRAMLDRQIVCDLQDIHTEAGSEDALHVSDVLRRSVDSYFSAVRTLVHVAELAVRRLPNNRMTMTLYGTLVRSLVFAYVEPPQTQGSFDTHFLRERIDTLRPKRFAERITQATERKHHEAAIASTLRSGAERVARGRAPKEVVDAIRAMFARDLVDIDGSDCGYGDVVCLLELEVTAQDPLLFFQSYNTRHHPTIVRDEHGIRLSNTQLSARYDFTLLMLLRAWSAPWSPESHHSFHRPFRGAVKSLFLCAHRVGMPTEIARLVSEYLHREWWYDTSSQCWSTECQCETAVELVQSNALDRLSIVRTGTNLLRQPIKVFCCPQCSIAHYCSREHQKADLQAGHQLQCAKPPFRIPGKEEYFLCQRVLGDGDDKDLEIGIVIANEALKGTPEEEEDDDSWESIDESSGAEDEEHIESSITHIITQWFKANAYECSYNSNEWSDMDSVGGATSTRLERS